MEQAHLKIISELKSFINGIEPNLKEQFRLEGDRLLRLRVRYDLKKAHTKLDNFTVTLKVKAKNPTYGEISFIDPNLKRYDSLKKYAGDYGFVVPIKGGRNDKVLRGEKKLKYKFTGIKK